MRLRMITERRFRIMAKIIEKIKNLFSGKFIYKPKEKSTQPAIGEEAKLQQEEPKPEEKPEEQK